MKYLSLFTGIGGFEKGIQQAYESNLKYAPISEESEQEERPQGRVGATDKHGVLLHAGDRSAPLCVGYSEIDKYATQIYQKHFPYEQCEMCRQTLQGSERSDLRPNGNQPDIKSGSNEQPKTWGDREFKQPKNNCQCKHKPYGDIKTINADELPDFDFLCGGFPCQSFSIAGKRRGFEDTRGTLFFDIARILKAKKPRLFLLENVKGLLSHDNGRTFSTIISTLAELGYDLQWQVLNSKNYGVPQNRERVFIVGHLRGQPRPQVFPFGENAQFPAERQGKISPTITSRYYKQGQSDPYIVVEKSETRKQGIQQKRNIANNSHSRGGSAHSTNLRVRRLTPTECERLQGFPDGWTEQGIISYEQIEQNDSGDIIEEPIIGKISDTQRYKCLGNAVTVNLIQAIMEKLI